MPYGYQMAAVAVKKKKKKEVTSSHGDAYAQGKVQHRAETAYGLGIKAEQFGSRV